MQDVHLITVQQNNQNRTVGILKLHMYVHVVVHISRNMHLKHIISYYLYADKPLHALHTFSRLGGIVVTHPLGVQEVPGLISGFGKGFYV